MRLLYYTGRTFTSIFKRLVSFSQRKSRISTFISNLELFAILFIIFGKFLVVRSCILRLSLLLGYCYERRRRREIRFYDAAIPSPLQVTNGTYKATFHTLEEKLPRLLQQVPEFIFISFTIKINEKAEWVLHLFESKFRRFLKVMGFSLPSVPPRKERKG